MERLVGVREDPYDSLDTCAVSRLAVFQTPLEVWSCTLLAEGDSSFWIQISTEQQEQRRP